MNCELTNSVCLCVCVLWVSVWHADLTGGLNEKGKFQLASLCFQQGSDLCPELHMMSIYTKVTCESKNGNWNRSKRSPCGPDIRRAACKWRCLESSIKKCCSDVPLGRLQTKSNCCCEQLTGSIVGITRMVISKKMLIWPTSIILHLYCCVNFIGVLLFQKQPYFWWRMM